MDLADIETVNKSIIHPHTLYTSAKSDMGITCFKNKVIGICKYWSLTQQ